MKGNLIFQQDGLRFDQWMFYDENIVSKKSVGVIYFQQKKWTKW